MRVASPVNFAARNMIPQRLRLQNFKFCIGPPNVLGVFILGTQAEFEFVVWQESGLSAVRVSW